MPPLQGGASLSNESRGVARGARSTLATFFHAVRRETAATETHILT